MRQAINSLRRRPAFALTSIALLALGVAALSAIFTTADVALFRALPFPRASELYWLRALEPAKDSSTEAGLVPMQMVRWRAEHDQFAGIEGALPKSATMIAGAEPEPLSGMQVTAGLFSLLGVGPESGRSFVRDEETPGSGGAIISYEFWQRRFGGENVLGKNVTIDGLPRTIVGVMPKGFSVFFIPTDLYVPMPLDASQMGSTFRATLAVGRLKPGVSARQGTLALDRINDAIALESPTFRRTRARVQPLHEALFGSERPSLLIVLAAVGLLLVIAGINVANLTLSDALARRQATATRLVLGAERPTIVQTRLTEALVLGAIAGAVGLFAGRGVLAILLAVNPTYFQGFGGQSIDLRLIAVTLGAGIVVAIVAALPAAIAESRTSMEGFAGVAIRSGGTRGDRRARTALVSAQVAIAVVLLFAAGLLARNLYALTHASQGFEPGGLLAVRMPMPGRYATPEQRVSHMEQLVESMKALPEVAEASASQTFFTNGSSSKSFYAIEGVVRVDSTGFIAGIRHMMPDLFRVMRVRLLEGRLPDATDRAGTTPVAVVSQSFARTYFNSKAIGARIRRTAVAAWPFMEIVGVVDDIKDAGVGADNGPMVWVPYLQENQVTVTMTLIARLKGKAVPGERAIKGAIHAIDPAQAIIRIARVDDLEFESAAQPRFQSIVVALFAISALLLVIGGIYAVTLYMVLTRTREIGVRSALGASPGALVGAFVWHGLKPVLIGGAIGLLVAVPVVQFMQRALKEELIGADLPVLVAIFLAMFATTALAAVVPARRATRVSPVVVMRA